MPPTFLRRLPHTQHFLGAFLNVSVFGLQRHERTREACSGADARGTPAARERRCSHTWTGADAHGTPAARERRCSHTWTGANARDALRNADGCLELELTAFRCSINQGALKCFINQGALKHFGGSHCGGVRLTGAAVPYLGSSQQRSFLEPERNHGPTFWN